MILHVFTKLDLGDLGEFDTLVVGEVKWKRTGPPGTEEGHCIVRIERITVDITIEKELVVLNVTKLISSSALATLEERLEEKYLKVMEGKLKNL